MTLCICAGIVEIGLLISAAVVAVLPFLSKLFRRKKVENKCNHRKRIPYVTSADVVKMNKRDKRAQEVMKAYDKFLGRE